MARRMHEKRSRRLGAGSCRSRRQPNDNSSEAIRGRTADRSEMPNRGASGVGRWSRPPGAMHREESDVARTSTYLNFARSTEEAFNFYKSVFGTEFVGPVMRHRDVPVPEGHPGPSEEDKDLVINVQLPILGGHLLM